MAGQYLTLGDIKQAVTYRGDLEGITDRHPTINMNQEVNLSWRRLRQKLCNAGVMVAMTPTAILTLPTVESVSGGGYAEIPWPTDAVSIHGLDARVGGTWCAVPQGDFAQRRLGPYNSSRGDYQFADAGLAMWILRNLPTATATAGSIMLFPVPSGGQYVLWYLPQWVDITTDSLEFPGQEMWLQWVIWDVVATCLGRDVGVSPSEALARAQAARDILWAEIKPNAQRLASDGPIQPQSRYSSYRAGPRMIP